MKRLALLFCVALQCAAGALYAGTAQAAECEPKASCFGLESVGASLASTQEGVPPTQAGAHPDLTLSFAVKQDPESGLNLFGLRDSYAPLRDIKIETPSGLVGNPNVLGVPQQCTVQELVNYESEGCPNGSQIGVARILAYEFPHALTEPLYMMAPPEGSDVVARVGTIAGLTPTFIDLKVRSQDQSDFGLTAEIANASPIEDVIQVDSTLWGVPAAEVHDTERCTPVEAINGCTESASHPPGSRELPFMINPTSCSGTGGQVAFSVDSWLEPGRFVTEKASLPPITGCDKLHFNPSLSVEPTSHRAAASTGLELSYHLPTPEGVEVLENSELKDIRIEFPKGMGANTASASGLETCSAEQVHFGKNVASDCPNGAKLGDTEFDVPALPRRMKGALYLRQPEPGHLFRIWVVADDLGAHIKLPGELELDEETGQMRSVVLALPQVPVREVRLLLKSGFRAPLVNPQSCGTYQTHWEFTPWSGTGTVGGDTPMTIDEGCDTGGFSPKLSAGSVSPAAGQHAPFAFALTREDGEQNPASLDVTLPPGLVATFAGIPRCEGESAGKGTCPAASRIGRVQAATGAGPTPLWTPEPGKRPTSVYLGGPYRGAPLSAIAVVPAQAGPFDLGDVVVRSAIFVNPETALATVKSDPLPQLIQGVPILYRVTEVILDRPNFTLNPTNCSPESVGATVRSTQGTVAQPSAYFQASGCRRLPFKPSLAFHLTGPTHRGGHPRLKAILKMPKGDANIAAFSVALPASELIDQGNFDNVCTRVQFAAHECPAGSVYGHVVAKSPLFDETFEGPIYLRSSSHNLPDTVFVAKGPPSLPIEVDADGRVDSINGGVRNTVEVFPDAPITSAVVTLAGGRTKGLFENGEELCTTTNRATAKFTGQNGKKVTLHPVMQVSCGKGRHKSHRHG
jgi:hypothetical protein